MSVAESVARLGDGFELKFSNGTQKFAYNSNRILCEGYWIGKRDFVEFLGVNTNLYIQGLIDKSMTEEFKYRKKLANINKE